MDGKFSNSELLFIERTLELHGEHLCDLLREEIQKKSLIKESSLLDSIDFSVCKYGIDPVLLISFISYGWAIEIAWHKEKLNTRSWTRPNPNTLLWGVHENRKISRKKDSRWYARMPMAPLITLLPNFLLVSRMKKRINRKIVNFFQDSALKWRYIVEISPGIQVMVKFSENAQDELVFSEVVKQLNG